MGGGVRSGIGCGGHALGVTYLVALVLLFVFTQSALVILTFPAWVLMVSLYILAARLAGGGPAVKDSAGEGEGR